MPTVNGHEVPALIPANQILIYFPQGILGLQKLEEPGTPASLDSNFETFVRVPVYLATDGSLKLEENGEYVLPSIASAMAPAVSRAITSVGRTVSTVLLGEEPPMVRGRPSFTNGVVDGAPGVPRGRTSAGHSRQSSTVSVVDMVRQMTGTSDLRAAARPAAAAARAAGSSGGGYLFDAVGDLVPAHASQQDSENFQLERKRMLGMYLTIHITLFVVWGIAAAVDQWVSCDCVQLGPWRTCTSCAVNGTLIQSSDSDADPIFVSFKPSDICGESSNFAECNSPSFQTVATLSVIAIIFFGSNIIIVLVDLVCHITPKRPFYPVFFLLIWSLSFATWLMMAIGEASPATYNLSKLSCEAQSNAANIILGKSGILVSNPLDGTVRTDKQLAALRATATATQNLALGCTYGLSLLLCASSWGLYTIVCFIYYYRRYASWNSITKRLMRHTHNTPHLPRPAHHRRRGSASNINASPSSGEFVQDDSVDLRPIDEGQDTPQRPLAAHPAAATVTIEVPNEENDSPRGSITTQQQASSPVDGDVSHFRAAVAASTAATTRTAACERPPPVPRPKPSQAVVIVEPGDRSPNATIDAATAFPAAPGATPSPGRRRRTTSLISPARDD